MYVCVYVCVRTHIHKINTYTPIQTYTCVNVHVFSCCFPFCMADLFTVMRVGRCCLSNDCYKENRDFILVN